MFKIQTLNAISPTGLNQFPRDLYEVASDIQHPDIILLRSHQLHHHDIPKSVKAIGRAGAGVNNIPVDVLTKQGIPVFNTPGANANAVKELVIAGMLLASRHLCRAWDYMKHLKVQNESEWHIEIEKNKKRFAGFELFGKTIGIIGLGSIGVKVANAAIGLGMNVIGYDPLITVRRAWELSANVKQAHSIDSLLMESDYVTLHVPLNDETKNLMNYSRFSLLKNGCVILNFARDGIIDNEAIVKALEEKKIATYVTDFPTLALQHHPNVISLPHLGASTREAEENCAVMIVKQIRNFLETGAITNTVNFPVVDISVPIQKTRVAIVNANVPNMVAQISSIIANAGLNISSLSNKSRENIAYTVIDLQEDIKKDLINKIKNIEGILQVRILKGNHASMPS